MRYYYFFNEHYEMLFYSMVSFVISGLILMFCFLITGRRYYTEKMIGYECGFDPFSDARSPFNVKFYIISMLFLLFDVEIAFFFPWSLSVKETLFSGIYVLYSFVIVLTIGFFYEWKKGALDWE
uniref:NADH-ubiquinone oxidoreductase chain 3 n=1 Tax=Pleurostomum flabellatum TaxID=405751 RepID=A0A7T0M433_9EUKA|nr:NADH dehydrogenase subunit 3 [Pleurostomum flabellatum]QPL15627.1 NADH dehydrogenase subunit 3 [Pleurostomum flabellatum]